MYPTFLFRLASQVVSAIMGGMGVFCIYYAGNVPDSQVALTLCVQALLWGGGATLVAYFQNRYFE